MANQLTMADIQRIKALAEAGWSARRIARELNRDRGTVNKYIAELRAEKAVNSDPDPSLSESNDDSKPAEVIVGNSSGGRSKCEPFRSIIEALLEKGLTAERIHRELIEEHSFEHSYPSVSRFVRKLKNSQPKRVWRMECEPGEEAQVDFGVAKTIRHPSGKLCYSNVLRVTLSHSRKAYTETVEYQNTECFLRAIENAFRHFGGTPLTLRIDNLKAGVKKADWYDPELNPKLVAFAEHYGTTIIPTRPYTPQHKGKVESDVAYVKSSALKGNEFSSITDQNIHLKRWEENIADQRIHGTTRKQVNTHFLENEKDKLLPLPDSLFPAYQEGKRSVHRDAYVEVSKAYYQVPAEYIGRKLWVRWDSKIVHIYTGTMEKLVSHVRLPDGKFSHCLGARGIRTNSPASNTRYWIAQAETLGKNIGEWANSVAHNRKQQAIRVLQGLIHLAKNDKHQICHIDQACKIAIANSEYTLPQIKQYLALIESNPANIIIQDEFEFVEEHTIIRPLSEYGDFLNQQTQPKN